MRNAYAVLGVGFVVIIASLALFNHGFTPTIHNSDMASTTLRLTSTVFLEGTSIPSQYTCDADGTPPPLAISDVPEGTKSFALIVIDPDVPKAIKPDGMFLHWLLFNIPPETTVIGPTGSIGTSGLNGAGKEGYVAPCPPKEYEPSEHRYFFHLYALDTKLGLEAGATEDEVRQAMEGHIIDETELIGKYKRK